MEKVEENAADTLETSETKPELQELQGAWVSAGQAEDTAESLHLDTYYITYSNNPSEEDDRPNLEALVCSAEEMASWAGQPHIKGSSESVRMALLTTSLIGLQFTWGIEMTYCTPYLLALGLTKSKTSLVWIAGPLSGLIMQPIVGVISDRSRSKYGRRRPFMVLGSLLVGACLLVLGWAKEIVSVFIQDEDTRKSCTIALAVIAIYAVDFAINAVQSCCRSLIVDSLPIPKQQSGSAWASRMVSVGHLIGYVVGTLDLVSIFGTSLGDTQFKKLTLIAACALLAAVGITSWAVTERVLISNKGAEKEAKGIKILTQIIKATLQLPPRIQAICWAQFWSWIGWFPFLFYSTTWVGETYFRYDAAHDVKQSNDALGDIGRIGSSALVIFSIVTLIGAFLLPVLTKSPDEASFTARPPARIAAVVTNFSKYKPDLLALWIGGHLMFAGSMILAPFANSYRFATTLVAICGLPWAVACWAPSTFLGIEVNRLSSNTTLAANGHPYRRVSRSNSIDMDLNSPTGSLLHLEHDGPADDPVASTGELSGLYFGILNIYATIPQFIGTFISMIVFSILEPGKSPELADTADPEEHHSTDGPNAIAVCLFIGAICNVGAAFATKKLRDLQ
ncbi:MFS general substrate transporter-36 [Coleophoma cylindrospora]|uniref:MFS general substrate transporter-36 n=1 Tax=Coleophoma cylindrospora TaxID=1849047 RepID=A0A3D8SFH6_9HELO|nr:MFS general substrate transporter-36 [Coleophoma cylindrospora]